MSLARNCFHQPALAHHRHAVGDLGDHAEIMGDEQDGCAVAVLQILEQAQDLRLGGNVEPVVVSSAMISAGSSAKAMAIITRWRCPSRRMPNSRLGQLGFRPGTRSTLTRSGFTRA
jgi:hypothetical protein